jgi:transcriptional regulator PpsR
MDARTAPAEDRPAPPAHMAPAMAPGTALRTALGSLSVDTVVRALAVSSDVALVVDAQGIVREVSVGGTDLQGLAVDGWLNRPWAETVLSENQNKIDEMIAGRGDPGRWRMVNHPGPAGNIPIRYIAIREGDGSLVAIGRDMRDAAVMQQRLVRAQQAMERDSLRLRQLEARYRLLFDSAPEAIVIIDAATRRMIEANPAARRLAGLGASLPESQSFTTIVHPDDRDMAVALLGAVAAAEQREPGRIRLDDGQACQLSATLFRRDRGTFLLVRLQPIGARGGAPAGALAGAITDRPLGEVLERMPDAFVLADGALAILASNGAFLDLVHEARSDDVRGEPLARFLGRPGIDLKLLQAQLAEHGSVRNFATVVRSGEDRQEEVEVSAVTSNEGGHIRHGFSIRQVVRRAIGPAEDRQVPRSVEQLTELVGRVSLKEIVRESTDLIERLCIEAALTYTADNRASAAEILGLSRQSLYAKLHRHGLGNLSDTD